MTRHHCLRCGADLCGDEVALYKKLVWRAATEYLCLDCLAAGLNTEPKRLQELIDWYHRTGICSLFAKTESAKAGSAKTESWQQPETAPGRPD